MTHSLFEKRKIFDSTRIPKRTTWGWALPILSIVFLFIAQIITVVPVFETGLIPEDDIEKYPYIIYMLFAPFSAIVLLIALWVRFFEGRDLASSGIVFFKDSFRDYGIGYVYGLGMAFIIVLSIWGLGGYELESNNAFLISDSIPLLILLIGFAIQSGAEEYLFRGWLFSRLAERYNVFIGIVVNAAIFALMHLPAIDYSTTSIVMPLLFVAMTILFSIFLSLMVIRQKSIWGAAAWHAAWNWFFINGFGLATTGIELDLNPILFDLITIDSAPLWLSGGDQGPEGSVLTVIVLLIGCLLIVRKKIFK